MKYTFFTTARRYLLPLLALLTIGFIVYKATAQVATPVPIDFDNGPFVAQKTPANVVLALSIEWPTSGEAYKDASYIDGKEYVGYFNSNRCYTYPGYGATPRLVAAFSANTDYFTPTGATNSSYQCNTASAAGTGFSGNYLNYATMSAPDILRMALTGGDRGLDTTALTVLDRGTLWDGGSADFRHAASATVTSLVTPFNTGSILYAYNCNDEVIFTTNSGTACAAPNNGDATDLRPAVASTPVAITTTVTPTIPPFSQAGVAWQDTGAYTTTVPGAGPVSSTTLYTTTGALTTTAPIAAAEPSAMVRTTTYTASGTSTVAPTGGAPVVIVGYTPWVTATGVYSLLSPTDGSPSVQNNISVTTSTFYCYKTVNPKQITLGPIASMTTTQCTTSGGNTRVSLAANTLLVRYYNYTRSPIYNTYTATPQYYLYTAYTAYKVYAQVNVWNTYASTAKAIVKPRVQVCDNTEGPTRTVVYGTATTDFYNYCTKYTPGGSTSYKPEGQIQQKSDSIRLSVMSYLLDDGTRNGGVLRAPMKYTGPNMYDTSGNLVVNPEKEWDPNSGIFAIKPITDATSTAYTTTGVINYLNRFGKTGKYKSFDPVGELWYESLRYLQGLQASNDATTGMTDVMKDSFPVYSAWTDPLTSGCQRNNYILGIGDTNTHYDRTLPGLTRTQQNSLFDEVAAGVAARDKTYDTTPTIKGSATALNAHNWTQIIDGYERSGAAIAYTDPLGRAQVSTGNPALNATLSNLDTSPTGSGNHASYHWAGLSYWANTQPIRRDTIGTGTAAVSADKVRVKTFMIDVDENDRGSITDQVKATSFYLAGKYGYFNDVNNDGKPFNGSDNTRWAEPDGSPRGYVLASQPRRLIAGIKKFFDESGGGGGSFASIAVSSNAFSANSPDGRTFAPSYIPGQWSGTIQSLPLRLNTPTNTLSAGTTVTWDAGAILTAASKENGTATLPQVKPADRKIVTYIAGATPRAVSFTYASLGADLPASFSIVPYSASVTDTLAEFRVNYIRGERTKEVDETMRPRQSIMGDVINSGPVYKGLPNQKIAGDGYPAFYNNNKTRVAAVYAGANDGMLHAFKADTGQELFAYIPGAVLGKVPNLTHKNYIHTAFVDAVPVVEEVKLSSGWKTVLASGMGGGAQGVFALDVTDPTAFDTTKVMFEFTDRDDRYMGNVVGQPSIVKMRDANYATTQVYKYFLAVSSGYNNYKNDGTGTYVATSDQALFFLDLSKPTGTAWAEGSNYFKVIFPAATGTAANGLAQPGIRYGSVDEALEFFAGDLQGNVWKAAFVNGINAAAVLDDSVDQFPVYKNTSSTKRPIFTAADAANNKQSITSSPVIYPALTGGNMIIFGTGKLLESGDRSTTSTHSIYGIWDSGQTNARSYDINRSRLEQLTLTVVTRTISITGNTPTFADTASSKRGWYFDLTQTNERVVIDAVAATGVVDVNSTIPPTSICSDNGDALQYCLSPSTGKLAETCDQSTPGYLGKSTTVDIDTSTALVSSYSIRAVSGRRTATKRESILTQRQTADGTTTTSQNIDITYLSTGRVYWREVRDFNRTNP